MKVEPGKKITIEYELTLEDGQVLESSSARGPLEYTQGAGSMLPAFEKRIDGMTVDEERSGTIPAEEAAGSEESLTSEIKRADFPEGEQVEIGKQFSASSPQGPVSFEVLEIEGDDIKVRFLHPLAGKAIKFRVKVLAVADGD